MTPWVYAIARYRLIDYLRRTNMWSANLPLDEAPEILADDDPVAVDSGLDLGKLMAELAPKTREAIHLVKLEGLSVAEAAARTGMSESAIKVSVHRGLKTLAQLVRRGRFA